PARAEGARSAGRGNLSGARQAKPGRPRHAGYQRDHRARQPAQAAVLLRRAGHSHLHRWVDHRHHRRGPLQHLHAACGRLRVNLRPAVLNRHSDRVHRRHSTHDPRLPDGSPRRARAGVKRAVPAITLRHVYLRYGVATTTDPGALTRLVNSATRPFFREDSHATNERRAIPEPPDREFVINDLSLTIRDGETMSVVGPSGCGKTTLLKVIAGLAKPDSGDVLYDATSIYDIPIAERGIGMVFQDYALYPHLESRENIGFYDMIRHQPERIPERIRTIVEVMGVRIEHLLDRKPPTLSGGEKQRVADRKSTRLNSSHVKI